VWLLDKLWRAAAVRENTPIALDKGAFEAPSVLLAYLAVKIVWSSFTVVEPVLTIEIATRGPSGARERGSAAVESGYRNCTVTWAQPSMFNSHSESVLQTICTTASAGYCTNSDLHQKSR
jgi:hypothetical protein